MNYYEEIRNELITNEVRKRVKEYVVNRKELESYYKVGKLIIEAQGGEERAKYGNQLIKEYSTTSLKYMRHFYLFKKVSQWLTNCHGLIIKSFYL